MKEEMTEAIETPSQKLLRDLRQVVRDGEELMRAGAQNLGEKGSAAREKFAAALDSAKETGRRLQVHAANGAKVTDKAIRDYPYQSLGIAFGVGLLIGVLVSRR